MNIDWGAESPIEIWPFLYLLFSYVGGALLIYEWGKCGDVSEGDYWAHCLLCGLAFVMFPILVPFCMIFGIGKLLGGRRKGTNVPQNRGKNYLEGFDFKPGQTVKDKLDNTMGVITKINLCREKCLLISWYNPSSGYTFSQWQYPSLVVKEGENY